MPFIWRVSGDVEVLRSLFYSGATGNIASTHRMILATSIMLSKGCVGSINSKCIPETAVTCRLRNSASWFNVLQNLTSFVFDASWAILNVKKCPANPSLPDAV